MNVLPPVAIGMPVYNGGRTLRRALESLVGQSFSDFVLLISDNASTDETPSICREFAAADTRIRYVRQPENIGAEANFRYVFGAVEAEYFMWAAADDTRSLDFLHLNLTFLQQHPEYVASVCPVRFNGRNFDEIAMGDAPLADDDPDRRLAEFFRAWHANGRFYSLFRRAALVEWVGGNHCFLGADWTLITHLATVGKLHRVSSGWLELGALGASNATDIFARYRHDLMDWVFPFHCLTRDTFGLLSGSSVTQKALIAARLAQLNLRAFVLQFRVRARTRKRTARNRGRWRGVALL